MRPQRPKESPTPSASARESRPPPHKRSRSVPCRGPQRSNLDSESNAGIVSRGALRLQARRGEHRPPGGQCRRRSGQLEVRIRKVLPPGKEWLGGEPGSRVGQAVAEVQSCRVASFPKANISFDCHAPVILAERHNLNTGLLQESQEERSRVLFQSSRQHKSCFRQCGRPDTCRASASQPLEKRLVARFLLQDRNNRRGIEDQKPSRPKPRMLSTSFFVVLLPRTDRGTWGQTSSSRKRRSLLKRSCRTTRNDSRSFRSESAVRIAFVLFSPVMAATSAASFSVSGSLMLRAILGCNSTRKV